MRGRNTKSLLAHLIVIPSARAWRLADVPAEKSDTGKGVRNLVRAREIPRRFLRSADARNDRRPLTIGRRRTNSGGHYSPTAIST